MTRAETLLVVGLRAAAAEALAMAERIEAGQWPGQTVDQVRKLHTAVKRDGQAFLDAHYATMPKGYHWSRYL